MGAAAGPASTVWNSADKNANISLSSGNLVAGKSGAAGTFTSVRASTGIDASMSGYFEVEVLATASPNSDIVTGLALLTASVNSYCGDTGSDSWGYYHRSGQLLFNAGATSYGSAVVATNVVGIAMKAGKVWVAINNTYQGSGNPVAGTGEAFSGLSGTVYPMATLYALADSIRGRFKTADFVYAPPSGFAPWGV